MSKPSRELEDLSFHELREIAYVECIFDYRLTLVKSREELILKIKAARESHPGPDFPSRAEISSLLLERHPDLSKVESIFQVISPGLSGLCNGRDMTYIDMAILPTCSPEVLDRMLIGGQYNIDSLDENGQSLLHKLVFLGSVYKIKGALNRGADPEVKNYRGRTPLYYTIDYLDIAELLIDAGADPNERGENGLTALEQAIDDGNDMMIEKLLRNDRLNIVSEVELLNRATDGSTGYTLLKHHRCFSNALFDIDPVTDRSYLTRIVHDLSEQEDGGDFEKLMLTEITNAKYSIAHSVLKTPRERMNQTELISVYDTVFTIVEKFNREDAGEKNLVLILCLGDMYERRHRFTVHPEVSEDGEPSKERELFFRVPKSIPMDGSVYSYRVPAKINTWRELVDSFDLLANYFDFSVEGENVNNSSIEIDDGIAVTIEVRNSIVQLL